MEAPRKIYRTTTYLDNNKGKSVWKEHPVAGAENVEYIRTDAFIEKAVDYIANNMRCDGYTLQTKAKFIKDFKKYMEG